MRMWESEPWSWSGRSNLIGGSGFPVTPVSPYLSNSASVKLIHCEKEAQVPDSYLMASAGINGSRQTTSSKDSVRPAVMIRIMAYTAPGITWYPICTLLSELNSYNSKKDILFLTSRDFKRQAYKRHQCSSIAGSWKLPGPDRPGDSNIWNKLLGLYKPSHGNILDIIANNFVACGCRSTEVFVLPGGVSSSQVSKVCVEPQGSVPVFFKAP